MAFFTNPKPQLSLLPGISLTGFFPKQMSGQIKAYAQKN
jgi:hypothetical protein